MSGNVTALVGWIYIGEIQEHKHAPGNPHTCPTQRVWTLAPHTLHPTPYTLHPTPYTLDPRPCTLQPTPCTLHPAPCTLHPPPHTLHWFTPRKAAWPYAHLIASNPTLYTLHPTPYTFHWSRLTRRATTHSRDLYRRGAAGALDAQGTPTQS